MLLRLSVFPSLFSWFSYLHSTIILYFCPAGNVYLGHICLRFLSNFASREGKCSKWHVSNCKFNLPPHLLHTHLKDREDIHYTATEYSNTAHCKLCKYICQVKNSQDKCYKTSSLLALKIYLSSPGPGLPERSIMHFTVSARFLISSGRGGE